MDLVEPHLWVQKNPDYMSQAMAWILVVGHALNLVLNKVSATSVYSFGIVASKLRKGDPSS
jgi:hypothetical protein